MDIYCATPMAILNTVATVANLSMVIHIFKANNSPFAASLIFQLIGLSNAACGIMLSLRWMMEAIGIRSSPLLSILSGALVISLFLQLGFNVSLAFLRYQVVINALGYFTSESKRRLERRLSLAVFASLLIVGVICAVMRLLFNNA